MSYVENKGLFFTTVICLSGYLCAKLPGVKANCCMEGKTKTENETARKIRPALENIQRVKITAINSEIASLSIAILEWFTLLAPECGLTEKPKQSCATGRFFGWDCSEGRGEGVKVNKTFTSISLNMQNNSKEMTKKNQS